MRRLLLFLFLASPLVAQTTGASISGTVFCNDTGKPAHFARVLLTPAQAGNSGEEFLKSVETFARSAATKDGGTYTPPTGERKKQQADAARKLDTLANLLSATSTGLDGSYRANGLKPGLYYVHAQVPGYVDPYAQLSPEDFQSTDPAVRARIAALPSVRIGGDNEGATMNLRLERGASLTGRVMYDDGSPAVGWYVWAMKSGTTAEDEVGLSPAVQGAAARDMGQPVADTDDRGVFRIAGLPDGTYFLRAVTGALNTGTIARSAGQGGTGIRLAVYSGGALRPAAATVFKVRVGDSDTVPDMIVPLKSLHTLSGHVTAAADGHPLNKGTVTLSVKDDPSIHLRANVQRDGSFVFEDLPGETTYALALDGAADATYTEGRNSFLGISVPNVKVQTSYATSSQEVMLGGGDNTEVQFSVAPADASAPATK